MSTVITTAKVTTVTVEIGAIVGTDSSLGITGLEAAQGGAILATGGTSSTSGNAGGAVEIKGGVAGATGAGGAASVTGSAGGSSSGTGGAANVTAGAGTAGNASGGNVVITPGAKNGSGKDGVIRNVGVVVKKQGAPATETTVATLTVAKLLTGIITATPTATGATVAYTLPTGTLMDGGGNFSDDDSFDWSVQNLAAAAADTITITAGTDHTVVGSMVVASAHATTLPYSSAKFRSRKTTANTWITYRIG